MRCPGPNNVGIYTEKDRKAITKMHTKHTQQKVNSEWLDTGMVFSYAFFNNQTVMVSIYHGHYKHEHTHTQTHTHTHTL